MTNVVKHFKWEPRGKRRIHAKPNAAEIGACRPWLETEIALVKPRVLVCLGATAAQALLGKTFKVSRQRGAFVDVVARAARDRDGASVVRSCGRRTTEARRDEMRRFVADLKRVAARKVLARENRIMTEAFHPHCCSRCRRCRIRTSPGPWCCCASSARRRVRSRSESADRRGRERNGAARPTSGERQRPAALHRRPCRARPWVDTERGGTIRHRVPHYRDWALICRPLRCCCAAYSRRGPRPARWFWRATPAGALASSMKNLHNPRGS